jgi:transcriptional regulator with XRE-family HTH domain
MILLRTRLGKAIAAQRRARGISQEDLAYRAKIHRTTMSEIERGVSNVSVDVVEKIARALSMPLSELFALTEHRER